MRIAVTSSSSTVPGAARPRDRPRAPTDGGWCAAGSGRVSRTAHAASVARTFRTDNRLTITYISINLQCRYTVDCTALLLTACACLINSLLFTVIPWVQRFQFLIAITREPLRLYTIYIVVTSGPKIISLRIGTVP